MSDIEFTIDPSGAKRGRDEIVRAFADIQRAAESLSVKNATKVNSSLEKMSKVFDQTSSSGGRFSKMWHELSRTYYQAGSAGMGLVNTQDQLSASIRRTARSVAILQGPLGPVAGRITTLGVAIGDVGVAFTAFGLALTGSVGALLFASRAGEQAAIQFAVMEQVLRTTNYTANQTSESIENMARNLGRYTLASTQEIRTAATQMLTFRNITEESFGRALNLAQDLAQVGFGSVEGAARQLSRALEDPQTGLVALRRAGVSFTMAQREMVLEMYRTGRVAEGQGMILDQVAAQVAGAGQAAAIGITASFDTLQEEIKLFMESMGTGVVYEKIASAIDIVAGALRSLQENSDLVVRAMQSLAFALMTVAGVKIASVLIGITVTAVKMTAASYAGAAGFSALAAAKAASATAGTALLGVLTALSRHPILAGVVLLTAAFFALNKATKESRDWLKEVEKTSKDLDSQMAITIDKFFDKAGDLRKGTIFSEVLRELGDLRKEIEEAMKEYEIFMAVRNTKVAQDAFDRPVGFNLRGEALEYSSRFQRNMDRANRELLDSINRNLDEIENRYRTVAKTVTEESYELIDNLRTFGTDSAEAIAMMMEKTIQEFISGDLAGGVEEFVRRYQIALRQLTDMENPQLNVDDIFKSTKQAIDALEPSVDSAARVFVNLQNQIVELESAQDTYGIALERNQRVLVGMKTELEALLEAQTREGNSYAEITRIRKESTDLLEKINRMESSNQALMSNFVSIVRNVASAISALNAARERYIQDRQKELDLEQQLAGAMFSSSNAAESVRRQQTLLSRELQITRQLVAMFGEDWRDNTEALSLFNREMSVTQRMLNAQSFSGPLRAAEQMVERLQDEVNTRRDLLNGIEKTNEERLYEEALLAASAVGGHRLAGVIRDLISQHREYSAELEIVNDRERERLENQARLTQLRSDFEKLWDSLDRGRAASREQARQLELLEKAFSELGEEIGLTEEIYEQLRDTIIYGSQDMTEAADPFVDAWERALGSIDNAFRELFVSAFKGFEEFRRSLKRAFQRLVGELAYEAAKRQILLNFGAAGGAGGGDGAAGGAAGAMQLASTGSSMYRGMSPGGLFSASNYSFSGGLNNMAGSLGYSGVGAHGPTQLFGGSNLGYGLSGVGGYHIGSQFGGYGGYGGAIGGMAGYGLATAGGSAIASSLSMFGSFAGPVGMLAGAVLGGLIGSMLGGNKKPRLRIASMEADQTGSKGTKPVQTPWDYLGINRSRHLGSGNTTKVQEALDEYVKLEWAMAQFMTNSEIAAVSAALEGWSNQSTNVEGTLRQRMELIIRATNEPLEEFILGMTDSLGDIASLFSAVKYARGALGEDAFNTFLDDDLTKFQRDGELLGDTLLRLASSFVFMSQTAEVLNLQFDGTNMAAGEAASNIIDMAGGIENLTDMQSAYYDLFFTEQEKLEHSMDSLSAAFSSIGEEIPTTMDEFRKLVESLDLMTEEGQQAYVTLLQIAPAFAQIRQEVENLLGVSASAFSSMIWDVLKTAESESEARRMAEEQSIQMLYEGLTTSLLDSVTRIMMDAVVGQMLPFLISGAAESATLQATGGAIAANNMALGGATGGSNLAVGGGMGGMAVAEGGIIAGSALANIVDQAIGMINTMAAIMSDPGFQEAIGAIGSAFGQVTGHLYGTGFRPGGQFGGGFPSPDTTGGGGGGGPTSRPSEPEWFRILERLLSEIESTLQQIEQFDMTRVESELYRIEKAAENWTKQLIEGGISASQAAQAVSLWTEAQQELLRLELGREAQRIMKDVQRSILDLWSSDLDRTLRSIDDSTKNLIDSLTDLGHATQNNIDAINALADAKRTQALLDDAFRVLEKTVSTQIAALRRDIEIANETFRILSSVRDAFRGLWGSELENSLTRIDLNAKNLIDSLEKLGNATEENIHAVNALAAAQRAQVLLDDAFRGLERSINERRKAAQEAASKEIKKIQEQTQEKIAAEQEALALLRDSLRELQQEFSRLQRVRESLMDSSQFLHDSMRRRAIDSLQVAIDSQDWTDVSKFADRASRITPSAFTSSTEYELEALQTLHLLKNAEDLMGEQISHEEEAVRLLEKSIETLQETSNAEIQAIQDALEEELEYLDSILEAARDQMNTLYGIDSSVLSVEDAVKKFQDAFATAEAAKADFTQAQFDKLETAISEELQKMDELKAELEKLEDILQTARDQLEAFYEVDNSVLSVEEAVARFQDAFDAAEAARKAVEDVQIHLLEESFEKDQAKLDAMYDQLQALENMLEAARQQHTQLADINTGVQGIGSTLGTVDPGARYDYLLSKIEEIVVRELERLDTIIEHFEESLEHLETQIEKLDEIIEISSFQVDQLHDLLEISSIQVEWLETVDGAIIRMEETVQLFNDSFVETMVLMDESHERRFEQQEESNERRFTELEEAFIRELERLDVLFEQLARLDEILDSSRTQEEQLSDIDQSIFGVNEAVDTFNGDLTQLLNSIEDATQSRFNQMEDNSERRFDNLGGTLITELQRLDVLADQLVRLDEMAQSAKNQEGQLLDLDLRLVAVSDAIMRFENTFGTAMGDSKNLIRRLEDTISHEFGKLGQIMNKLSSLDNIASLLSTGFAGVNQSIADVQGAISSLASKQTNITIPVSVNVTVTDSGTATTSTDVTVPAFASGGLHSGGLRLVGERGPELEVTGPSRIVSNDNLLDALSNRELIEEVRNLRREINELRASSDSTARNTHTTARQLQRWSVEGVEVRQIAEAG